MAVSGMSLLCVGRLAARHPRAVDLGLAAFIAVGYLLSIGAGADRGPIPARGLNGLDVVAAVVTFVLIAVRRRLPLTVLGLAVAATVTSMVLGEPRAAGIPATAIAAYTVATLNSRRVAWAAGGSAAVLLYGAGLVWPHPALAGTTWWERGNVAVLALVGMAVAVGDAIRTRRAYLMEVEERARRAEESREEEARRRVIEERLRIARELHDVVAHNLALISVQAGVAGHLMQSRPDQAAAALEHVRQAANTAVAELGTVLSVLRQDGDPDRTTEPVPGLTALPTLLDTVGAAGLRVRCRQAGQVRVLPAAADLAAYRIIQESLTNAHKHGTGDTTDLHLTYTDDGLAIEIANPSGPGTGPGTGHGLIGMRERAAAVGGTLRAGPQASNTFAVRAFLPAPRGEQP
ncbi:histidine kinase [Nonomuraea sp. NBC_00507]|uniref:sensor histidine kinase n=1 Tax=Nonomuraea sp. NBC_00507 TaxID=2976002 RepID=UPI002E194EC5